MNAAREKVENEGQCRVCREPASKCDAAHVIDRSLYPGQSFDEPLDVVPLCSAIKGGAGCHDAYDAHRLDLLPYLAFDEQAAAVAKVGIVGAYQRTTGERMIRSRRDSGGDVWSL